MDTPIGNGEHAHVAEPVDTTQVDVKKSRRSFFRVKKKILLLGLVLIAVVGITVFIDKRTLRSLINVPSDNSNVSTKQGDNSELGTFEPDNAVFKLQGAAFADYKESKSTVKPVLQAYSIKRSDLSNLEQIYKATKQTFSENQLTALETSGFFLQPTRPKPSSPDTEIYQAGSRSDDMVDLYSEIGGDLQSYKRLPENAVFVTTDFLLHVYHVLVDRTFQKTEETYFQPWLKNLTDALYRNSLVYYKQETNPELKASWKRLVIYYLVPKVLLESSVTQARSYFEQPAEVERTAQDDAAIDTHDQVLKQLDSHKGEVPDDVLKIAREELDQIMKSSAFAVNSPFYGNLKPDFMEDYTQYTVRSHYRKNSVLRSYFRSMMWYGRRGFDVKSVDLTRDAMLMSWQLGSVRVDGIRASDVWEKIYLPTVFFVGRSDDLTFYEYFDLIQKAYGNDLKYDMLKDPAKLLEFQKLAHELPGPKILSEVRIIDPKTTKERLLNDTKGFRFMGQRFIPDSYMFGSLTQGDEAPDPETGQKLPSTPTALMVMSILGSNTADGLLNDWVIANAPNSDKVIAKYKNKLTTEFKSYNEKTWTQNIYWSWLYNLKALFEKFSDGYPMFMRNDDWNKKSLNSALGSWTELRHDTLLYAKQSYAELGGGEQIPQDPAIVKGYVEPNINFLTRLLALSRMTRDGLLSRGILDDSMKGKYDSFIESVEFFKIIAEKELTDSVISNEEYERLRTIIRFRYPSIVWSPDGDIMTEREARSALIADVHTDAVKGQVLYQATGAPSIIYVAVKDKGGVRLTRGVTYTHYEFTKPVTQRMTDEDWHRIVYHGMGALPPQSEWIKSLLK